MSAHLLIDAGNTRIKAAWLEPGPPAAPGAIHHLDHNGLAAALTDWLGAARPAPGFHVWISNVAGAAFAQRLTAALAPWRAELHWPRPSATFDRLHNEYERPEQLGVDHWLGLLGVLAHVRRQQADAALPPVLLAQFGTATTIDALVGQRFIGGLILPGYSLMLEALVNGTAALPLATGQQRAFPRNTHDAIVSGVAAAQAGAVLRQRARLMHEFGQAPLLFVAGGAWPVLAGELRTQLDQAGSTSPLQVVDNPVLDGLARVATLSHPFSF